MAGASLGVRREAPHESSIRVVLIGILALATLLAGLATAPAADGHVWRGKYVCSRYSVVTNVIYPHGTLKIVDGNTYRANGSRPHRYRLRVKANGVHILNFRTGPYRNYFGEIEPRSHDVMEIWHKRSGDFLWQCDY